MTTDDDGAFGGSAVMRAGTVVDFDELLDELEFRLTRCASGVDTVGAIVRKGGSLAAGDHAHRIARSETYGFWNEHRISVWASDSVVNLMDEILAWSPRYLAWALVPLLTELAPSLVTDERIERIVEWLTDENPVERVVRDAFTLTVLVKWLAMLPEPVAINRLEILCDSLAPGRVRMGCIGLGAYLDEQKTVSGKSLDTAFSACLRVAARVDTETALAVGWALRAILAREPEQFSAALEKRVQVLSRQSFRTAVERLAPEVRARLTARWLLHRREQRDRAVVSAPSVSGRAHRSPP